MENNYSETDLGQKQKFMLSQVGDVKTNLKDQLEIINKNKKLLQPIYNSVTNSVNENNIFVDLAQQHGIPVTQQPNQEISKGDKYDPYINYLFERDLLNKQIKSRYDVYYVSIDSSSRTTLPQIYTTNTTKLQNNSLQFTKDSTTLIISQPNHNFNVNDQITLTGIFPNVVNVRTSGMIVIDEEIIENIYDNNNNIYNRTKRNSK